MFLHYFHQAGMKNYTTKEMIIHAVGDLKEKKGASTTAIRKYLTDKFDITQQRTAMVTRLLRTADEEGWLVQVSGTGASSGSHFKLPADAKKGMQKKEAKEKKEPKAKSPTKRKTEKKLADKEVPAKKKKAAPEKKKATTAAAKNKKTA